MGKSRQPEHEAFLQWLIQQINQYAVDVVLVVGDIFDTGTPPSYARELYNNFVVALQHTGAQLVLLAGNHDSPAVLSESRELLACLKTHVIPTLNEATILPLKNRLGEVSALLAALPFLRARDLLTSQAGQSLEEKQQALQQAIADTYTTLYQRASAQSDALPLIATGHLTTVGAQTSDSVREIYIGTLEALPTSAFPAFDYIALGHIHRPQTVGGHHHIRYCGSPIALSFDETTQAKSVLLVDFSDNAISGGDASGDTSSPDSMPEKAVFEKAVPHDSTQQNLTPQRHRPRVTPLLVPVFQPMQSLRGTLESLEEQIAKLTVSIDNSLNDTRPVWLDITVEADGYLHDLHAPLRKMTEGLPVEILRIHRERKQAMPQMRQQRQETLIELTPLDVFHHRLASESLSTEMQAALEQRYMEVLASLQEQPA